MDSRSVMCEDKDRFGTLGCLGEYTVAYAPYDLVGDLNMYYRQDDGKIGKLPVKTNGGETLID